MEEGRSTFKILTGANTGKRPLGRPRQHMNTWTIQKGSSVQDIVFGWISSEERYVSRLKPGFKSQSRIF